MNYIFILINFFVLLNCKLIDNSPITIKVEYPPSTTFIGNDGGLVIFETDYREIDDGSQIFNYKDIEEKTKFDLEINGTNTQNSYDLKCRLYKQKGSPNYSQNIYLFCDLEKGLKEEKESFNIQKNIDIQYSTQNITINMNVQSLDLYITNVPFIYPPKEEINVKESDEKITLELNYALYNDEPLILMEDEKDIKSFPLIDCKKESKILKCEILKKDFDKQANTVNKFRMYFLHTNNDRTRFKRLQLFSITINYPQVTKTDVYIGLVKLLDHEADQGNFITFETNVTDINMLKTKYIEGVSDGVHCFLMKYEESKPLYLICALSQSGEQKPGTTLGFSDNNLHYKYNFILQPGTNEEIVTITQNYNAILFGTVFPQILDFTTQDSLNIYLAGEGMKRQTSSLRLNENGADLSCKLLDDELKVCTVPSSHFNGKSGNYFIRHKNSFNRYVADYSLPAVTVKVNSDKINKYSFGLLILVCLMLL